MQGILKRSYDSEDMPTIQEKLEVENDFKNIINSRYKLGSSYAQYQIARNYHDGGVDTTVDWQDARKRYAKAAVKDNRYAQYCLAKMYFMHKEGNRIMFRHINGSNWSAETNVIVMIVLNT